MITYTSSPSEIKKEAKRIDRFFLEKNLKAMKVYRNWLERHKGEGIFLLGKSKYMVNNNRVFGWWVGESTGRNNIMCYAWACETPNKDGKLRYVVYMPLHYNDDKEQITQKFKVLLFTHHFCQRLQERHGKTFLQWWEEGTMTPGTTTEFCMCDDGYVMLCHNTYCLYDEVDTDFIVVKTTINEEQQYENQLNLHQMLHSNLQQSNAVHDEYERTERPKISYNKQRKMLRNYIAR